MLEINNLTDYKFCRRKARRLFETFVKDYKLTGTEVSLAVVGAKEILRLNEKYRGINKATDVLSFSNPDFKKNRKKSDAPDAAFLGEIFINAEEVGNLAVYQEMFLEIGLKPSMSKARFAYLFYFLFAHGLLHLAGLLDDSEKKRLKMLSLGKKLMDKALI
jgi:probable rRNA maturation factor